MISLIICSRTPSLSTALSSNIKETIGAEYETILVDNSENTYSIFEAYNIGVSKSNFPLLCFMHDDITYHTNDWGKKMIDHFEDGQTGAIGVAGSPYAPYMPGSWWGSGIINQAIIPMDNRVDQPVIIKNPETNGNKNEVILIDGVWMCIRKKLFDTIAFDEKNYTGYHIYDLDISMQVHAAGYKLYCIFDVLMQHNSRGTLNKNYFDNAFVYQKKWRTVLPAKCIDWPYNKQCQAEYNTLTEMIIIMIRNKVPKKEVYFSAIKQVLSNPKAYLYYKTPVYLFNYLARMLFSKTQATKTNYA